MPFHLQGLGIPIADPLANLTAGTPQRTLSKNKQPLYKNRPAISSKGNFPTKDQPKPSSQYRSNFRFGGGTGSSKQDQDRKDTQQSHPFHRPKQGGAEVAVRDDRTDLLPVGES